MNPSPSIGNIIVETNKNAIVAQELQDIIPPAKENAKPQNLTPKESNENKGSTSNPLSDNNRADDWRSPTEE